MEKLKKITKEVSKLASQFNWYTPSGYEERSDLLLAFEQFALKYAKAKGVSEAECYELLNKELPFYQEADDE